MRGNSHNSMDLLFSADFSLSSRCRNRHACTRRASWRCRKVLDHKRPRPQPSNSGSWAFDPSAHHQSHRDTNRHPSDRQRRSAYRLSFWTPYCTPPYTFYCPQQEHGPLISLPTSILQIKILL